MELTQFFDRAKEVSRLKCPACGEEINSIGYTEHGTLKLDRSGEWLNTDRGADADYYCLECDYHFTYEELEELGAV